ncbi:MAG: MotA/TolQ/ExbB proton channel family protein [Nitrospirae bacterium]|nr:MotA/TolQ/ExbB proton channel family protein [Nitrospirota bacterium]
MNIATILGIIFGIGILSYATSEATTSLSVFYNFSGIAIVLGGTIAATFICYPLKQVMQVFSAFFVVMKREDLPIGNYIHELVYISEQLTTKGRVNLEKELPGIENIFLKDAVQMLIDGYSKEELREILDTRINQTYEQEMASTGVFRSMAKFSPAFGLIGTLIGLISMMQTMGGDIKQVGPAMAVALTATLYGILLAYMVFLPIAVKVEGRIEERIILMSVIRDGILFMKDKAPGPIVMDKLKAYLPPRKWSSIKKRS